ncbi:protein-L-isoaspartate(D-aspartate) O-methyltransferase [Spirochaetota bacterium]
MEENLKNEQEELIKALQQCGISNKKVLEAIAKVPRHHFVPEKSRKDAYANMALPIAFGQTISQPYIVALMTELLDPQPSYKVLELGTGSGYQSAILAELVQKVYTIELLPSLSVAAQELLASLGYDNIEFRIGDGKQGWPEAAPFDAIMVTAAPRTLPPKLASQLKEGGRLVIPTGISAETQTLWKYEKRNAILYKTSAGYVRFVPLL